MSEPQAPPSRRDFATITLCGLIGVFVSSAPVLAIGPGNGGGQGGNGGGGKGPGGGNIRLPPPSRPGPTSPPAVPEINPGAAASALTLAAGGTLIIADRLRRRDEPNADDRV
jgi:hypothetical protein